MAAYTAPLKLTGYADSALAGGRFGRSTFQFTLDLAKVGAAVGTGLVNTDTITGVGTLPKNCVVRCVAAAVGRAMTALSGKALTAIPITLKAGSTTLASMTLADVNGPLLGVEWTDVSLADGTIGVNGAKSDINLAIGAVLDADGATALTGGLLVLSFSVDYMPEPDEMAALFDTIDEISDGGNAANEVTCFGPTY